jgi:hypothetical protein
MCGSASVQIRRAKRKVGALGRNLPFSPQRAQRVYLLVFKNQLGPSWATGERPVARPDP